MPSIFEWIKVIRRSIKSWDFQLCCWNLFVCSRKFTFYISEKISQCFSFFWRFLRNQLVHFKWNVPALKRIFRLKASELIINFVAKEISIFKNLFRVEFNVFILFFSSKKAMVIFYNLIHELLHSFVHSFRWTFFKQFIKFTLEENRKSLEKLSLKAISIKSWKLSQEKKHPEYHQLFFSVIWMESKHFRKWNRLAKAVDIECSSGNFAPTNALCWLSRAT